MCGQEANCQLHFAVGKTDGSLADLVSTLFIAASKAMKEYCTGLQARGLEIMADIFRFYARLLGLHIAAGSLPMTLMLELHSCWIGSYRLGLESSSVTFSEAVQGQAWLYLSAGCPPAEIDLLPEQDPGSANLEAIEFALLLVRPDAPDGHSQCLQDSWLWEPSVCLPSCSALLCTCPCKLVQRLFGVTFAAPESWHAGVGPSGPKPDQAWAR